jgi:hypothetical protein
LLYESATQIGINDASLGTFDGFPKAAIFYPLTAGEAYQSSGFENLQIAPLQ